MALIAGRMSVLPIIYERLDSSLYARTNFREEVGETSAGLIIIEYKGRALAYRIHQEKERE